MVKTHKIDGNEYVMYDELVDEESWLCDGCAKRSDFIKKHKLKNSKYTYARLSKGKWRELGSTDREFDKLFLLKSWFDNVCEEAPDILRLKRREKFRDIDGEVIECEVRGERDIDKCYFKAKDIATGFRIPSIVKTLLSRDKYRKGTRYVYFLCETPTGKSRKTMFITFQGIISVLTNSDSMTEVTIKMLKIHARGGEDSLLRRLGCIN
ncbi:MAG: hypothetical protein WAX04_00720 [Oscillospiraceae bacterium]